MAIVAAIFNLFNFFQKVEQSNFMAILEVIAEYGGVGSMTHFPNMLKQELEANWTDIMSKVTKEQMKEGKKAVREKFLAALMLSGANGQNIMT
jgi:hypothetical protein